MMRSFFLSTTNEFINAALYIKAAEVLKRRIDFRAKNSFSQATANQLIVQKPGSPRY